MPVKSFSQSGYSTGLNGSVIDLPCNQNCVTNPFQIPHLKATSDYIVSPIPFKPYDFVTPTGNEVASVYADDLYSDVIDMPFNFCFYDSVFSKIVIGSNGVITFETANANCANAWSIAQQIPFAGGVICSDMSTYYPRASIMIAYSDLDLRANASPADRKIEWRVEGTAPFRRLIVSYFHVGVFGNTCGIATPNTFQVVLYETSGVIEMYIQEKACVSTSSGGKAILGIQNWNRDKAVAAPGKNSTVWNESGTAYRFLPSGNAASRFVRSQVYSLTNTLISTGDTSTTTPGVLDIKYQNFCPPAPTGQFVIRSTFSGCAVAADEITVNDTITVNKTNGLNASVVTTKSECGLAGTGSATVTVPAGVGTGPYTFTLMPGNISKTAQGNALFTNLASGNYTMQVTDATGTCVSPLAFTIENTGVLNISFVATNTSCAGAFNGNIQIEPPNGTPPLSYSVNGSAFTPNNVFSNLGAGLYFISVRDNAGCVANNIPVTIDPGEPITMTTIATATTCPGLNNGTITVTGSSGTGPFTYSINGGLFQPNATFNNLAPGTYFLALQDAVGCKVDMHQEVVTQGNSPVTGTVISSSTSCNGAMNGTITVTPTSGTGPYEYTIDNGANWQAGNIFNALGPGNYMVRIREGGACISANLPATVATGPSLIGTAVGNSTACIGVNNGSIIITPDASAVGPFEYALDGGVFQASNQFNGVAAGNHTVLFRNAGGCSSMPMPVVVAAGTALTAQLSFAPVKCNGTATGVITITPNNGSAPYQYSLDGAPSQASNIFNTVTAGIHSITITDAFGCTSAPATITVTEPAAFVSPQPVITSVTCNGTNTGKIIVSPTGGVYPYSYSLDNINFQNDSIFLLGAGTYSVYVKDLNGCGFQFTNLTILQPPLLTANIAGTTNATCTGGNDGTISILANGGVVPYSYTLDGINFQSSNLLNAKAGNYTVIVRDANNCTANLAAVVVGLTNSIALNVADPAPICQGTSVQLTATGNATQYSWASIAGGISNPLIANPVVSPASTSIYTVTATLGNCTKTADVNVNVLPAPLANAGQDAEICYGQNYQLQGSGGLGYTWTPSTYLGSNMVSNPTATKPSASIIYSLMVTDANNCRSLVPDEMKLNVIPPIKITISPTDTIVQPGAQFQIIASSIGTNYNWTPASGLSDPTISSPVVIAPAAGTNVIYHLTTTTDAGCEGQGTVSIKVYKGPDIYVPNAFTPNNDGHNDTFYPFPVGVKELKYFRVFNRWGQMVFATSTLMQGWDGKMGGSEQGSGVFVWNLKAVMNDGSIIERSGTVTLIR